MTIQQDKIIAAIRAQIPSPPKRLGVAVSGGSDSLALMMGLHAAFCAQDVQIFVATVDHGLRPQSAEEAQQVASHAARLGLSHTVLNWQNHPAGGNLQDHARNARYRLLSDWAHDKMIGILAVGHTADDQAETVLMRMRRESGINGLAGIPARRNIFGVEVIRPLLTMRRDDLRTYLQELNTPWIDDPSNLDDRFERVRIRKALTVLEDLGIPASAFSSVAENLRQAHKALEWYSFISARDVMDTEFGAVTFQRRAFRVLPSEIAHRLVVASVRWLTGQAYTPRRKAMAEAIKVIRMGGSFTFSGCRILSQDDHAWIFRELNAVHECAGVPGTLWDERWLVYGGEATGHQVRALAENGLRQCPNWRDLNCPKEVLQATPAVWENADLVAAPCAGMANGWTATLKQTEDDLFTSFLTH